MGLFHSIKVRLGLEDEWDDEYYEDAYDEGQDEAADDRGRPSSSSSPFDSGAGPNSVRRVTRGPDLDRARYGSDLRSVPTGAASVTPVSAQVKVVIIEPKTISETEEIARKFMGGCQVILRLSNTKPELRQRFVDFASGLVAGLEGTLKPIESNVFMLTPHNVQVSDVPRLRGSSDPAVFSE